MARRKRSDTDKVQRVFDYSNLRVEGGRILAYYLVDPSGRAWVPYGGGPLYHDSARKQAAWLAAHVRKYSDLLPKALRQLPVVYGSMTSTGRFAEQPEPATT